MSVMEMGTDMETDEELFAKARAHMEKYSAAASLDRRLWDATVRLVLKASPEGRPSNDRVMLDSIYATLRGIPEAMESIVAPQMDGGRMQYWANAVREAVRLSSPPPQSENKS